MNQEPGQPSSSGRVVSFKNTLLYRLMASRECHDALLRIKEREASRSPVVQQPRPVLGRRGRPEGSTLLQASDFQQQYALTYRALWERTGKRPTQFEVAAEMGMGERTLRRYLKRDGMPWPPR
jgi:hypothetical protein